MKHIRLNDKTGKLLRISMEYTQLEAGISTPFYKNKFETLNALLTPTWVTHLWEYWSEANVTLELTKFWLYESRLENDKHIMDLFHSKVNDLKQLHILNSCRIALKIITIADMVDWKSGRILPSILLGRNNRESDLNWPNKEVPDNWWKEWKTYCETYIAPYINTHPIGKPNDDSHQKSPWRWYEQKKMIYNVNERTYFKQIGSRTRRKKFIQINNGERNGIGKIADIQRVGKFIELLSTRKILLRKDMQPSLSLIPLQIKNKKMLNKHITIKKNSERRIGRSLRHRRLVAASDGSAHAGIKASFAYCFANSRSGKVIYASHGPTLVDPEYSSSDRSELLGILGVVTKLHEIEDGIKDRINKKKRNQQSPCTPIAHHRYQY